MPSVDVNYPDQTGLQRVPRYIKDRWELTKKNMEPLHERIATYRRLYDFNHYNMAPKANERRIEWPDYTNAVDLAVSILSANPIDFKAYGFTPGSEEGKRSSIIEKVLNAAIHISSIRDEVHIQHNHLMQVTRDGCSVIRTVWDTDYHDMFVEDYEESQTDMEDEGPIVGSFKELPLRVQVLDPSNFYVIPGGKKRWLSVFYAEERTIEDVEKDEGVTLPGEFQKKNKQERETEKHEFIDYWEYVDGFELVENSNGEPVPVLDPTTGQPMLDDEGEILWKRRPVLLVRNAIVYGDYLIKPLEVAEGYDDIPYTVFWWKPIGQKKPEEWGESLLHAMQHIVPHLETRFNRQARLIDMYASLPLVSRTEGARKVKLDPGIGRVAQLSLEEDLGFPTWPGTPPDVADQMLTLQAKSQESSFPAAMYGEGVRNMAGYAISQLIDSGQIRLTTPIQQLEQGWAIWAHKTLNLIKNFAENAEINVYGTMRGKFFYDKVVGRKCEGFRVDVQVKPKYPGMDTREIAHATQASPFLSKWTIAQRYLNVPQPDDEIRRMNIEKVKDMPAFQELIMLEYLQELADEGNNIAKMLMQRYMTMGMPGEPGRPPSGPAPEAISGAGSTVIPGAYPVEEGGTPFGQEPSRGLEEMVRVAPNLAGGLG